jgi:hypothetical protein
MNEGNIIFENIKNKKKIDDDTLDKINKLKLEMKNLYDILENLKINTTTHESCHNFRNLNNKINNNNNIIRELLKNLNYNKIDKFNQYDKWYNSELLKLINKKKEDLECNSLLI